MADRKNKFLIKRSNVAGKIPTAGDLLLGEMALNTADVILYTSGTTAGSILPIGWDRVNITGDTMTGPLYGTTFSANTISATTFYGDGSNLTGINGSITGGTNIGGATEIFSGVNGSNLEFRTLTGATNEKITTVVSGDTIEIDINEPNLTLWPLVVNGNQLISGGVTYLSGLTFDVSALVYIIGATIYNAVPSQVTLASGDTSFDRIDVIYVDVSGNTGSVAGVPSTSPSKPTLDSATQVEITFVTVPAGGGTPNIDVTNVYDENLGIGGGEWDYSASTSVRISGDSVADSFSGSKSIEFINAVLSDEFTMDNPTPYDTNDDNIISFYVKNVTDWSGTEDKEFIDISFRDSGDTINGTTVRFDNGTFGFDASNTADWQVISISLGSFSLISNLVSKIRFQVNKDSGVAGDLDLYIDLIRFQAGAPTTSPQNIWLSFIADDENVAIATSNTDQFRLSGGTNIGTTIDGNTGVFNLDDDITLNSVSATSINTDYIDFNTTFTGATIEARLHWEDAQGGLSLGMEGGNVSQQIGQENYYYIKNQSGATIENGKVVMAAGVVGASGRILGEYMIADGTVPVNLSLGVATEDILNGTDGFVTEFGAVRGIDTTGTDYGEVWSDGDILWVSSTIAGGLTNVQPTAPNYHIEMAIVLLAHANGSIFVRPHRYPHIHDLQEVAFSGGAETNLDILQWDSASGYFDLTNTPNFNSVSATTISATTFYGDGSNLTNITATWDGQEVITVGETVLAGDLLYLGSGSTYLKTSNTSETTSSTELRIAIAGISSGSTGQGLIQGQLTTTSLTSGDKYWLGTGGNFTNIQPTGDGDIVRYIGTALDSTTLEFMPDETWIELSSTSGPSTQPLLSNVTTSSNISPTDFTVNVSVTGDTTQTLPTAVGIIGKLINVKNSDSTGTSTITINTTSSQTMDGNASGTVTILYPNSLTFQSDGSNWILI